MSRASVAVMVLSVAGLSTWVGGARAQECKDDTSCGKGFRCQVTAVSACAGGTPTPDIPGCAEDEKCTRPAMPLPEPMCETKEYRSCVPAECMSDADCATGMVCHAQEYGDCTDTAPAEDLPCKDGICPPREPPAPCTSTVKHQCVPRYLLPCEQSSDCGASFTCEAQKRCGCSAGSAGAEPARDPGQGDREAPADAGAPADFRAPSPPPDCTCEVTAEKYCKLVELPCKSDSECPADFSCKVTATSGSSGGTGGAGGAASCAPGADGGCAALPAPQPPIEQRHCLPPYSDVSFDLGSAQDAPTRGETTGTNGGSAGKGGDGDGRPVQPPGALTGAPEEKHSRSCSATHPGTHGMRSLALWASLLTLAAAAFVTRRRR